VLHPVGDLPAHVYWRRRAVVLAVLLTVLGGAGWLGFSLLADRDGGDAAVPCLRALDKGLQEIIMFDTAGNRVWGSNDCFPEAGSDQRTLAPGEVVTIPVTWGGLTSEPTCTAARDTPAPGTYLLRARLDTKVSADASITLG
jgi:hypothetical protein